MELLTGKLYYGNTVKQWLIAAGIIICTVLLAKLLYWAFGNIVKKITAKTKTRIDDILVDMLEEPVVFSIIIIGVWYGLATLEKMMTPSLAICFKKTKIFLNLTVKKEAGNIIFS